MLFRSVHLALYSWLDAHPRTLEDNVPVANRTWRGAYKDRVRRGRDKCIRGGEEEGNVNRTRSRPDAPAWTASPCPPKHFPVSSFVRDLRPSTAGNDSSTPKHDNFRAGRVRRTTECVCSDERADVEGAEASLPPEPLCQHSDHSGSVCVAVLRTIRSIRQVT